MLVTTPYAPSSELIQHSKRLCVEMGGKWVPRQQYSLTRLRERYGETSVMIVLEEGLKLCKLDVPPLFFHPSTSIVRIKRMLTGEEDLLIRLSGVSKGDSIIDCTAGLASDAIVFAYAAGEFGKVTAIESELLLYIIIREGLSSYESELVELNNSMRRLHVVHDDHLTYLQRQESQSCDIVYFDPMFRVPLSDSSAILPLRAVANASRLSLDSVVEAKRVARKSVVLKEHRNSEEFDRLGFTVCSHSQTKTAYGVIKIDDSC